VSHHATPHSNQTQKFFSCTPPPSRSRTRRCQLDSATTQGHRPPDSVDTHHNSISATTRGPCGLDSTAIRYGSDAVGRQSEATAPRCRRSLVRGHRPSTPPPPPRGRCPLTPWPSAPLRLRCARPVAPLRPRLIATSSASGELTGV
jgi:hypothetical protein